MGGRKRQKGSLAITSGTLLAITVIIEICLQFTNAIDASISADQIVLWGSSVTLTCTLNQLQTSSPSEILWYKDSPEEALPSALSQVVGNLTSRLTLSVVTDEDSGIYYCALPSDGKDATFFQSSRVVVGKLPASPTNIQCQSRDMLAFWCTWQVGEDLLLETRYTFLYKSVYSRNSWRNCPDSITKGENSCYVSALSNSGQEQVINITSTNALGHTWRIHRFNPSKSTIPHPPTNVRAEIVSPREVISRWDLPMEWQDYMSNYLSYKLRIWVGENDDRKPDKLREIPSRQLIRRGRFIQASFHVINNLMPGSEYHLQAACKYKFSRPRGECWSNWSMPVGVELPALAPSGTVNDLEVSEYHQIHDARNLRRDVILTWEPVPFRLQNGQILNYTLFVKSEGDAESNRTVELISLPADVTSYQINDLNLPQEYSIGVSACNTAGCGPNATIKLENIQQLVPLQPVHLRVLDLANQSLLFTWSNLNFGSHVDHFLLQWTETPQATVWQEFEIPGGELEYIVNNPDNPATYSFRVQAFNSLQRAGPWSRTLTVHLDDESVNGRGGSSREDLGGDGDQEEKRWEVSDSEIGSHLGLK